jgi:hypothetical protein
LCIPSPRWSVAFIPAAVGPGVHPGARPEWLRILAVDDDRDALNMIAEILEVRGR